MIVIPSSPILPFNFSYDEKILELFVKCPKWGMKLLIRVELMSKCCVSIKFVN
jgi:hypothetical protein